MDPLLFESQSDGLLLEVVSGRATAGPADGIREGVCVCDGGEFIAKRSVIKDRSWREARTPRCHGNLITVLRQTAGRRKMKVRQSNFVMTLRLCTHIRASIAALWQHTIAPLN